MTTTDCSCGHDREWHPAAGRCCASSTAAGQCECETYKPGAPFFFVPIVCPGCNVKVMLLPEQISTRSREHGARIECGACGTPVLFVGADASRIAAEVLRGGKP